ncbi:LacI family DNA-binding transcriptional regulator [Sphingobium ummariense]|uniref:LacI family DNA-binding transcriptional regulator n=1 Tax=Sphingobium ummariense TaxID=420994 RepID=UPI0004019B36|nr:LacI family DNA-binding transcriptional regulator [Sphingobium ummariense]
MVTIYDVANKAGVGMKTVSRVLNDEAHVRPAMRARVLQAIEELGYRPNLAARQLAANRSFLISFIMNDVTSSYQTSMLVAASAECRRRNYHLVVEIMEPDESATGLVERVMANLRPDGIMLVPPLSNDADLIQAIANRGTKLVRVAATLQGYGHVVPVRDTEVSQKLVAHLLASGKKRIALIAPPYAKAAAHERVTGYKLALAAAELPLESDYIVQGDFTFASGKSATERLLGLPQPPDAIFAANDAMALGAMAVLQQRGIGIPEDMAVAGFDDSPGSRTVYPPLTTVRQPISGMARDAIAKLLGGPVDQEPLVPELIIRGSTQVGFVETVIAQDK